MLRPKYSNFGPRTDAFLLYFRQEADRGPYDNNRAKKRVNKLSEAEHADLNDDDFVSLDED